MRYDGVLGASYNSKGLKLLQSKLSNKQMKPRILRYDPKANGLLPYDENQ